ncbi:MULTISPECIES: YidH family protein [unclassified Pseudomonas]|uniref:YidH family protein n=1 Tax=unclassified Pseudomonas TaxID=196821 RepID=UPI003CEF2A63
MSDLNDPRVFFAAERTLLAWNRTSLSLMAFGFVIERSGLLLQMLKPDVPNSPGKHCSFWIGLAFLMLGSWIACWSSWQYKKVVKTLRPVEIPLGYSVNTGPGVNVITAILGVLLMVYLFIM